MSVVFKDLLFKDSRLFLTLLGVKRINFGMIKMKEKRTYVRSRNVFTTKKSHIVSRRCCLGKASQIIPN